MQHTSTPVGKSKRFGKVSAPQMYGVVEMPPYSATAWTVTPFSGTCRVVQKEVPTNSRGARSSVTGTGECCLHFLKLVRPCEVCCVWTTELNIDVQYHPTISWRAGEMIGPVIKYTDCIMQQWLLSQWCLNFFFAVPRLNAIAVLKSTLF